MISVMIVDDHPVFRDGLRALLETQNDLEIVAVLGQGGDAPLYAEQTRARVVLLDMTLPDRPGTVVCSAILDRCPTCKVIILSADDSDEAITGALGAGAAGYILKTEDPEHIISAVRAADRGETILTGPVAQKVVRQLLDRHRVATSTIDHLAPLTDRERQVFHLAAQGFLNSEIASRLTLSEETIKSHLRNIYTKLGLTNKADLRIFALQAGSTPRR